MHLGLQEVDGKRASMPLKEIGYRLIRTFENTNKKRPERGVFTELMAEWTGLEPATPGVTGRYSNQLNYHS